MEAERRTNNEVKKMFTDQELGLRKTPLTFLSLTIGGSMLGLASQVFTLTEALLLIIAVAEVMDAGFDYFNQEVNE